MSSEKFTFAQPGSGWTGVVRYAPGHAPAGYAELSPDEQLARLVEDVIATLPPELPPEYYDSPFWVVRSIIYERGGLAIGHCGPPGPPGPPGQSEPYKPTGSPGWAGPKGPRWPAGSTEGES